MTAVSAQSSTTNKILGYPLNVWYVAAWDKEVTRNPLARQSPAARWRSTARGRPAGRARRRLLAPVGTAVHGQGSSGTTRSSVRTTGCASTLPDAAPHAGSGDDQPQRDGAVVPSRGAAPIRLGMARGPDPGRPDLVPDMHQMDDLGWAGDGETIHAPCNYQLVLDNLMDLTHEEFVHGRSIGQDELSESDFDGYARRRQRDRHAVDARRRAAAVLAQEHAGSVPGLRRARRSLADHPLLRAPSTICIDVGVAKAGTGAPRGRPQPGRQRLRDEHHHPGDRADLPLLLGVHAQLPSGQPADHHPAAARASKACSGRTRQC